MGELHGRVDVELLPRRIVYACHHLGDLDPQLGGLLAQDARVGMQARALHAHEHRQQRHLHLAHELGGAVILQRVGQHRLERPCGRGLERSLRKLVGRLGQRGREVVVDQVGHRKRGHLHVV